MVTFFKGKYRPIGLDIGHRSIKMIQLSSDCDDLMVSALDEVRLDPMLNGDSDAVHKAVVDGIDSILRRGHFNGREVVSCLSNDVMKIKSFRLNSFESGDMDLLVAKEAEARFGLEQGKYQIEYMVAGNVWQGDDLKHEVIVFAADKEMIAGHIKLLEDAGLVPVALDTVPCAVFRSFQRSMRREEDQDVVSVMVDVGWRYTTLVIGRGKNICFVKQIPIGGAKMNEEVAERLGININEAMLLRSKLRKESEIEGSDQLESATRQAMIDAMHKVVDQLAHEISLCFQYFSVTFRGKRPRRALFAGGEANEDILVGALRRHLAVDVEIGEPLHGFDVENIQFSDDDRGLHCEWAVAVGLSMKGAFETVPEAVSNEGN